MSASTKIVVTMLAIVALYVVFLLSLRNFNNNQLNIVLNADRKDKEVRLDDLVKLLAANQEYLTNDYSVWDDVISFLKTKDRKFSEQNFDTALPTFSVDTVWVYNLDRQLVYSVNSYKDDALNEISLTDSEFSQMYNQRFGNFFMNTSRGVMNVYFATIHPTGDPNRKTAPYGYFLIGRIIGAEELADISKLITNSEISLRKPGEPAPSGSNNNDTISGSSFLVSKKLVGIDGQEIGFIDAVVKSAFATEIQGSSNQFLLISISFGFIAIGVLFILLYLFVSRPLRLLSDNLVKKDINEIKRLEGDTSEFGKLALALDQFFEQQLKIEQEKSRTEALLESIGDGVIGIDKNWNIVFLNSAACRVFGIDAAESFGKSFRERAKIIRTRDRTENVVFIEEAMLYGKVVNTEDEISAVSKDNHERPIVSTAAPIFDSEKKTIGAVIIIHDAEKEVQSRLLRSDFTYASHQLRTPVTEAMWAVNLALEEKDVNAKNRDISIAARSIESVHKLAEHLLEVSQLDQRIVIPKIERVEVKNAVDHALESVDRLAKERFVKIQSGVDPRLPFLNTDGNLLKRIVYEVVENAVLYGTAKSTVVLRGESQEQGVLITVHNEGRPILERELPLIFTKFFRGSESIEVPGAGLGLYIVREYLKLLNGKIWFTSVFPEGTTFYIFIPYA
jgi:PAS domain S-box-containing protein